MQYVDSSNSAAESEQSNRAGEGEQPRVAFTRLPIFHPDRTVWGYSLAVVKRVAPLLAQREQALEEAYHGLKLPSLALDRPVLLWATAGMLDGSQELPEHDGALGLLVQPRETEYPDLAGNLRALSERGVMSVLFDYQGSAEQNALLPVVTHVMIDWGNADLTPSFLANHAQTAGVRVIAENFTADGAGTWPEGADFAMGSIFGDHNPERELTAGEVQCLEAVRLLSEENVDPVQVATVLGTDPAMAVRVLRLVNASSEGLPRRIDSLQQAIVLLGPSKVSSLVMASLISSTVKNVDNLWLLIARGAACRELAGEDAAYTVGLLSALSYEASIPARKLVEQTRVSPVVAAALTNGEGKLGQILTAVIAHEHDDDDAVVATGLSPERVALAYLTAIPWALSTVISAVSVG